jgi:hypothetical protein
MSRCLLIFIGLTIAGTSLCADEVSVSEILSELEESLATSLPERARISLRGKLTWVAGHDDKGHYKGWYHKDGDRYDFGDTGIRQSSQGRIATRRRCVIRAGYAVQYSYGFDVGTYAPPEFARCRALPRNKEAFTREARASMPYAFWFLLSGAIPGDKGATIVDVLRDCPDVELRSDMETVDGHRTYVLRADTEGGDYTVWVDPESGYLPRRIRVHKQADDMLFGRPVSYISEQRLNAGLPVMQKKSWTYLLDSVKVKRIGEHRVITGFSGEEDTELVTGTHMHRRASFEVTDVELTPSFEGTHAFVIDLANGALVFDLDNEDKQLPLRDGHILSDEKGEIMPYAPPRLPGLVGEQSPDLHVKVWIHGDATRLETLRGTNVVLAFWDSADESSNGVTETLNGLANSHSSIAVIAVHTASGDPNALRQLLSKNKMALNVALDGPSSGPYPGATFEKYEVIDPPAVFIIDAESKVRYQDIPLAAVEEAVKSLLDEQ